MKRIITKTTGGIIAKQVLNNSYQQNVSRPNVKLLFLKLHLLNESSKWVSTIEVTVLWFPLIHLLRYFRRYIDIEIATKSTIYMYITYLRRSLRFKTLLTSPGHLIYDLDLFKNRSCNKDWNTRSARHEDENIRVYY